MKLNRYTALAMSVFLAAAVMTGCGSKDTQTAAQTPAQSQAAETPAAAETKEEKAAETEKSAETENADKAQSSELKEFDVVLDWYPNAVHSFIYEAIEHGYFAEEGLKINVISPAESVDAMTFVAADKAQIGITYPVDVITAVANEKMPVVAIGALVQEELNCMASLAETDITEDMSTLKGKKIGHSGPAVQVAAVKTIMANAGLTENDAEIINVGFDLVSSLTTKSVDIVAGPFINDEIITMRNAGYDINVWRYQDYGVPSMYGLVFAANKDAYAADPELYKGFLRACAKGFEDMKADEEHVIGLIMSEMNSDDNPLDETQQRGSYETLMPLMEKDGQPFLSMTEETWKNAREWMLKYEIISEACDVSEFFIAPEL